MSLGVAGIAGGSFIKPGGSSYSWSSGMSNGVSPPIYNVYFHENGSFFTIPLPQPTEYALWCNHGLPMLPVPGMSNIDAYNLKDLINMAIAGNQIAYDALDKAGRLPAGYGAPLPGSSSPLNEIELSIFIPPKEKKCECGSEKTYGKGATHSSWCPKYA